MKVLLNGKTVAAVYDNGTRPTLVNYNVIKEIRDKILQTKTMFNTISGVTESGGKIQIKLQIGEIEDIIEAHVIKNNQFQYDLLIGLDAISKFRLSQDENLQIHQNVTNI